MISDLHNMEVLDFQKPVVHVEVLLAPNCSLNHVEVLNRVQAYINGCARLYFQKLTSFINTDLDRIVESITICDVDYVHIEKDVSVADVDLKYCLYTLNIHEEFCDEFSNADSPAPTFNQWLLPSHDFHGLWESLFYEPSVKSRLINYVSTMLLFSDKRVDSNIINWNRVALLHGPPGSGKTSLCRALAHKLCIRLGDRYKYGHLIEVNSHSLFSKWFSESGKLVMKMFNSIKEVIEDECGLVILLIDEVESLTRARSSSVAGTEPSDAIRVVNALLTQIDSIKKYPNVLILTTSNLSDAIDLAFVDRADIKQYIGLPTVSAIYEIYFSCINELMRVSIISPAESLLNIRSLKNCDGHNNDAKHSSFLYEIARRSQGFSGRTLRKIPLITHASFIQYAVVSLKDFLRALMKTVEKQFEDLKNMAE